MNFVLVVPTYNPGVENWREWIDLLLLQTVQPVATVVFDSSSDDGSMQLSKGAGFDLTVVEKKDFDHGGTRNEAVQYSMSKHPQVDVVVLLTQDSLLVEPDALKELLNVFNTSDIAVAYGRQKPHESANPLAEHARKFNYGSESNVFTTLDVSSHGIDTVFCSNSFAAYSTKYFKSLGGFPEKNILGEDMLFACRALRAGLAKAYVAEAVVRHSHNYTLKEEFSRYFDTGVFHSINAKELSEYSEVSRKGFYFVRSECGFLIGKRSYYLFIAPLYWCAKYIGFNLGKRFKSFPVRLNTLLSMHKSFWN